MTLNIERLGLQPHYNSLPVEAQTALRKSMDGYDWDELTRVARAAQSGDSITKLEPHDIVPITVSTAVCAENLYAMDSQNSSEMELDRLRNVGCRTIAEGKVAIVVVAGGMGSRLGFDKPKACFEIGHGEARTTLLGYTIRRIQALERKISSEYNVPVCIPIYVMASDVGITDINKTLEENQNYGHSRIMVFTQDNLPTFDLHTSIPLLSSPTTPKVAPNGNGGLYLAMFRHGIIDSFKANGIEYFHTFSIDNVLTKPALPLALGFINETRADAVNIVVRRTDPKESVGSFAHLKIGNTTSPAVIEYSEVSEELGSARGTDGGLILGLSNICNHIFRVSSVGNVQLPLHPAIKKLPYYDLAAGRMIQPDKPNGVKLEYFIFDIFRQLGSVQALIVDKEDNFAAIKNATGPDSPETAVALLGNQYRRYLYRNGIDYDTTKNPMLVPGVTYDGENLNCNTVILYD